MKIKVVTYQNLSHRLASVMRLLTELSKSGVSVQLVHSSADTVRSIGYALATQGFVQPLVSMMSAYELQYTPVEADCIVFIDGDLAEKRTVARLEALGKPVHVLIPQGALPPVGAADNLVDLLREVELYPAMRADEEYPRTFACHHVAETCISCEGLVTRWKAARRDAEVQKVAAAQGV